MLKAGQKVKGIYYGKKYIGELEEVRPWYGKEHNEFLVYYVHTELPIEVWKDHKVYDIAIMPHAQATKDCTIQEV